MNLHHRPLQILCEHGKHRRDTDIELIFPLPYSLQLNPIELIWKSIKRIISRTFVTDQDMMIEAVKTNFFEFSENLSKCDGRIRKFVNQ